MRSKHWNGLAGVTAVASYLLAGIGGTGALAQSERGASDGECVPLAQQHPNLGTPQSISARHLFTTVWGSFDLPGGPCVTPPPRSITTRF